MESLRKDEVYEICEKTKDKRKKALVKHHSIEVASKLQEALNNKMRFGKKQGPSLGSNKALQALVAK